MTSLIVVSLGTLNERYSARHQSEHTLTHFKGRESPVVMMQSRASAEFDAADRTSLVHPDAITDAVVEQRITHDVIALDRFDNALWDDGRIAGGLMVLNLHITEHSSGGDTYFFTLEASAGPHFSSPQVPVLSLTLTSDMPLAGRLLQFAVSAESIRAMLPSASHVCLVTELSGEGPPTVTYRAWLSRAA